MKRVTAVDVVSREAYSDVEFALRFQGEGFDETYQLSARTMQQVADGTANAIVNVALADADASLDDRVRGLPADPARESRYGTTKSPTRLAWAVVATALLPFNVVRHELRRSA